MRMHPRSRELYRVVITTDPAVTNWEASFDSGGTWHPAILDGDVFTWLVAGPDADAGAAVFVALPGRTRPLLRAVDNPEIIVRDGPAIIVG